MYERDYHAYHAVEVKYIFLLESLGILRQFSHSQTSNSTTDKSSSANSSYPCSEIRTSPESMSLRIDSSIMLKALYLLCETVTYIVDLSSQLYLHLAS